jgi:threonine/homoserine/homoserine lactone efflux protein
MLPDSSHLLIFALACATLIVVPGPSVVYIVARTLGGGRRAGLISALGVEVGGMVHVAAAVIGVSAVIAASAELFTVVKVLGAAYLILMGLRALRHSSTMAEEAEAHEAPPSTRRVFGQGVLVSALNPKTAIFFVAFLPQFADPARGPLAPQLALLGLIFIVIAWISDSMWAVVAGAAAHKLRSPRGRRWTSRASGGAFVLLGAVAATARRAV